MRLCVLTSVTVQFDTSSVRYTFNKKQSQFQLDSPERLRGTVDSTSQENGSTQEGGMTRGDLAKGEVTWPKVGHRGGLCVRTQSTSQAMLKFPIEMLYTEWCSPLGNNTSARV